MCRVVHLLQAWGVLERSAGNAPLARELFKAALKVGHMTHTWATWTLGHTHDTHGPCMRSAGPWLYHMLASWFSCISTVLECAGLHPYTCTVTGLLLEGLVWTVVCRQRQGQWQHNWYQAVAPYTHKHNASSSCCIVIGRCQVWCKQGGQTVEKPHERKSVIV